MWAAAGGCGHTATAGWSWWTCRRSGGLCGWCSRRRWRCSDCDCEAGTVTEQDPRIAPEHGRLTTRAGRWATRQAKLGRTVAEVADELGCSRHPVNASVRRWGEALLEADTERISAVVALGLDEHLMWRRGRSRTKARATGIVDAGGPAVGHSPRPHRQSTRSVAA